MELQRIEGIPACTEEQLNAAQSENQETRVNERLKKFVKSFVEEFENKMQEYSEEIQPGEGTKKKGKIVHTFAEGVSAGAAGGAVEGMDRTTSMVGIDLESTKAIETPIKSLFTRGATYLARRKYRRKAKNCIAAITSLQENKDTSRRIIAEAGFDIFQSFEEQFSEITDTDGSWRRGIEKLARDAVGRAMNYFDRNAEQVLVTSALITKAVVMGESKKGMAAAFSFSKPGHTVKSEQSGEIIKCSEIYSKTGLVMIEDNDHVHYRKKNDDIEKFGFRLAFEWELEKWDEELNKKYEICERPSRHRSKLIINADNKEQMVSAILKGIDEKDPLKVLKRTNKVSEDTNETLKGVNEQLTGILEDVKTVLEKNKDKGSIFFNVRDPVESFTGRRVELKDLHDLMQKSSDNATVTSRIVSISGLGGVGKTQLVRQYIHEYCQDYDDNILWMDAENYETLTASLLKLAGDERVGISTKDVNGIVKDVETIVDEMYRYFANGKSLFVFDNADKYSMKQDNDPRRNTGIVTFLPSSLKDYAHKPHFIFTSRNQEWPKGVQMLKLHVFTEKDATDFIRKALIKYENNNEMHELAETLQYFPLALQQAVAYIRVTNNKMKMSGGKFDIIDYLEKYQEETEELLGFEFPEDSSDIYLQTTLTTWKITTYKMRDHSGDSPALNILDIIAYIAPDNIPAEIFMGLECINNNREKLGDAILLLVHYSMIQYSGADQPSLNIHRLVQQVMRLKLSEKMRNEEVIRTTLQLLVNCYPYNSDKVEDISIQRKLLIHSEVLLTHIDDWSAKNPECKQRVEEQFIIEILELLCHGYRVVGDHRKQKDLLDRELAIQQKYLDPEHPAVARTLVNLGNVYGSLGDPEKKKKLLERALEINERHYGIDNFETAVALTNLGTAHNTLGNSEKGMEMLERALAINERHYGFHHPRVAGILTNLGAAYVALGKNEKAKELLERAVAIMEGYYGSDHPDIARALMNLGIAYGALGNLEKQREKLERGLVILERHYGTEHLEIGPILVSIGTTWVSLGNPEKGKEFLERALLIEERHCGFVNRNLIPFILENLGTVYGELGHYHEAYELYERLSKMTDMQTCLHPAVRCGNLKTVEYILGKGADIVARNAHNTVLHSAVNNSNSDVLRFILDKLKEKYPDNFIKHVNAKDTDGDTPLIWAAQKGKVDAAKILLEYGADPNSRNNGHMKASHWAEQNGHREIAQLLLDHNADHNMGNEDEEILSAGVEGAVAQRKN